MRRALFLCFTPILITTGCIMPRAWKADRYTQTCAVLDEPPKPSAALFITLRLPHCRKGGMAFTNYRTAEPRFASLHGGQFQLHDPNKWRAELDRRLAERRFRTPILFIHGYNNSNADALARAHKVRDLLQHKGEVVALTWPSYGKKVSYLWDEVNAAWSADQARTLIPEFAASSPTIIVAHSMGNHLAMAGIDELQKMRRASDVVRLIMASPDVERELLKRAIERPGGLGVDTTIYVSLKDQALSSSWRAHGYPRAGDLSYWVSGRRPYFQPFAWAKRVQVVDTTSVDKTIVGHTAFIDTPAGRADLCRVIMGMPERDIIPWPIENVPANYFKLNGVGAQDECNPGR